MSDVLRVERLPHDDVARAVELRLKLWRDRPRIITASVDGHGRWLAGVRACVYNTRTRRLQPGPQCDSRPKMALF